MGARRTAIFLRKSGGIVLAVGGAVLVIRILPLYLWPLLLGLLFIWGGWQLYIYAVSYTHLIGAGIAGLSTGCYARMNGWSTRIFEMHERPGGLCTAWSRKGYTFDGCIHHLAGAGPGSRYRTIWEELGAADLEMDFQEVFVRCEDLSGRQFNVCLLYTSRCV